MVIQKKGDRVDGKKSRWLSSMPARKSSGIEVDSERGVKKKKKIKEKIKENKKKKDEHNYRRVGRRDEKFSRRAKTFSTDKSDESYFSVTAYYHRQMHTHARPWQTRLHTIRNVYRM